MSIPMATISADVLADLKQPIRKIRFKPTAHRGKPNHNKKRHKKRANKKTHRKNLMLKHTDKQELIFPVYPMTLVFVYFVRLVLQIFLLNTS